MDRGSRKGSLSKGAQRQASTPPPPDRGQVEDDGDVHDDGDAHDDGDVQDDDGSPKGSLNRSPRDSLRDTRGDAPRDSPGDYPGDSPTDSPPISTTASPTRSAAGESEHPVSNTLAVVADVVHEQDDEATHCTSTTRRGAPTSPVPEFLSHPILQRRVASPDLFAQVAAPNPLRYREDAVNPEADTPVHYLNGQSHTSAGDDDPLPLDKPLASHLDLPVLGHALSAGHSRGPSPSRERPDTFSPSRELLQVPQVDDGRSTPPALAAIQKKTKYQHRAGAWL